MTPENPLAIDVATRTTRGRACPRCGGKIIPSDRAVYQNSADPDGVFPIWQCERCGYEEMAARPKAAVKAKPEATKQPKSPTTVSSPAHVPAMSKPRPDVLLDAKSRPYPPDVLQLVERMKPVKRES
jgi:DNA-directed RNA polymerase subunit M/transcription elongation factor TFIIS